MRSVAAVAAGLSTVAALLVPASPAPAVVPAVEDRAVITSGDETGLHVLVADAAAGHRWRTAATLAEPGIDTDLWIGQHCVTGSGRRAVVVYAPRQYANREETMERGGFAAVVDLESGAVTKLAERVSLAYYNPGCGSGETAVLSRLEDGTWLGVVDTAAGGRLTAVRARGQLTSAIPYRGGLVAAKGNALVEVLATGAVRPLARLDAVPFRVLPDGPDAVAFQTVRGSTVDLRRLAAGSLRTVASAPVGTVKLRPGAGGRVYIVGGRAIQRTAGRLPGGWRAVDAAPDSTMSTTGQLAVTGTAAGPIDGQPDQVSISVRQPGKPATRRSVDPQVTPAGLTTSPVLRRTAAAADHSTTPWDPDRACAVPRNDPTIQVFQPSPKQVEWAANLAVRNQLTFQRQANWLNNGLPAYSPQGMFPSKSLSGGGSVPAQVLLGILAQESNMWQASFHAVDGSTGNPLTSSGFYGIPYDKPDPQTIDWTKTDCGYGAAQVTTGMRAADTGTTVNGVVMDYTKQKAVVLDYATNVAAGLRILQDKWNVTRDAGLVANNGDPSRIENWWFAIWAYNTGFYPRSGTQPWGVGWANNPANPRFPADRQMFLTAPLDVPDDKIDDDIGYDNAKHPSHWSYPERVIGFAYTSLRRYNFADKSWGSTYRVAALRNGTAGQPGRFTFCVPTINECDKDTVNQPGDYPKEKPGPCTRDDLKCWWNQPVTWTDCAANCGVEDRKYTTVEPRPLVTNIYPAKCSTTGLPTGAKIIDDISTSVPLGSEGCAQNWTKGGTFGLTFGSLARPDGTVVYPSKVDFHQIGGGFGGHFWFAHSVKAPNNDPVKVTGTWTVDPVNAWTRVFVHTPDHGAHTQQADYKIYLPGQTTSNRHRAIPTRTEANTWVDIGVFDFRGTGKARIELSNFTQDGKGVDDVAWDAIAIQPLPAKPRHFVVAMGDSFSSGEGAGAYTKVSNQYGDDEDLRNSCRRSANAWSRQLRLSGAPNSLGALADSRDSRVDYHLVACSGARTHNVLASRNPDGTPAPMNRSDRAPDGSYRELTQIDRGFLDENTTLVVLTIGGNDARFGAIGKACGLEDCAPLDYVLEGDDEPMRIAQDKLIVEKVKPDVRRVIDEIRRAAPNAWIELAGYPRMFHPGSSYMIQIRYPGGDFTVGATEPETRYLNDLADQLGRELLYSDVNRRITSVDVRADFGGHGLPGPGSLYFNGALKGDHVVNEDGDPKQFLSMETFHPNVEGNTAYALAVGDHLDAFGVRW